MSTSPNGRSCSISFGASFRSNIKGSPFSSKTIASALSSAAFNICSSLAICMDSVSTNTKYHQLFRLSLHCFRPRLILPFFLTQHVSQSKNNWRLFVFQSYRGFHMLGGREHNPYKFSEVSSSLKLLHCSFIIRSTSFVSSLKRILYGSTLRTSPENSTIP